MPRIWCTVVLAMLVVVLGLSAGCTGRDYVPNRDIVVLKLTPDCSLEWTRVIDDGFDDAALDLIEISGGGYAIAAQNSSSRFGPSRPVLIRLSQDGAIDGGRFVTDGLDVARAVIATGDGGTAVLTGNGTVVRFDPEGRMLWERATGIPEAYMLLSTSDGGCLVGGRIMYQVPVNDTAGVGTVLPAPVRTTETGLSSGGPILAEAADPSIHPTLLEVPRRFTMVRMAMVMKLAPDGAIDWERQYDDHGLTSVESLTEGPEDAGFLLAGEGTLPNDSFSTPLLVLRLDPEGTPGQVIQFGEATSFPWSVRMKSDPRGYRILYQPIRISQENYYRSVVDVVLDRDGRELEHRTIDASIAVTWTENGGYFSVGIPPGEDRTGYDVSCGLNGRCSFHARVFDSQGMLVLDRVLPTTTFSEVTKVVQTVDGGYAILALRQNE
ncbi:hypothetical protein [Methanosphaerula palustris]|nr:hypothetical protein [Methanosphaerula palustris]